MRLPAAMQCYSQQYQPCSSELEASCVCECDCVFRLLLEESNTDEDSPCGWLSCAQQANVVQLTDRLWMGVCVWRRALAKGFKRELKLTDLTTCDNSRASVSLSVTGRLARRRRTVAGGRSFLAKSG